MILAFILYTCILLTIVWFTYKKNTSESDFVLGSRSLNFWVTAISAHASDMSAWIFMGYPSLIFLTGVSSAWIGFGLVIGMFLNWHFVAPRLRVMTEKLGSLTLSTFLENKYHDHTGFIRVTSGLICLLFFTFYVASSLVALGLVFDIVFNIPYGLGVAIGVVVAVLYTIFGGYITVAWTDLFQGLFLVTMIVLVPVVAFTKGGGVASIVQGAQIRDISLKLIPSFNFKEILTIIGLILSWGLGYVGQPHILTKFMGLKKPEEMYKSKYFGTTYQFFVVSAATFSAIVAIGFFKQGISNPELIFIEMTKDLFYPFAAGLVLCGIIAASISTMETQILVQASIISEDIYKRIFRPKAKTKELLWISRLAVITMAVVSFFIAFFKVSSIYNLVLYSWAGLGASFGPIILLSLYSRRINRHGAIAALLTGATVSALWTHINKILHLNIPEIIPAFALSICSAYLFSYLARNKFSPHSEH
ncbi:MAG: High-affinity proline transporter PutP [Chlamydiae bacterium]|nr:High-affinity proline transporter PutP [Chlamydiota bacterium]